MGTSLPGDHCSTQQEEGVPIVCACAVFSLYLRQPDQQGFQCLESSLASPLAVAHSFLQSLGVWASYLWAHVIEAVRVLSLPDNSSGLLGVPGYEAGGVLQTVKSQFLPCNCLAAMCVRPDAQR